MKKIFKFIASIFIGIYKFFDKILITPISKLVYRIKEKFGGKSHTFEKMLMKKNTLIYLSLILAFICFFAIDKKIISLVETESMVLTKQTIDVDYNDEAYVVEGLPESADIILMGRKSDLYLAGQLGDHKITLDLSGLGTGTHKVNLKYNNPINTLNYKLDPSAITIVIYPKISEVRTLSIDTINTDKLKDTLVVSSVTLDKNEIIIKSYKEKLATVASVKAIVDVSATNATVAGTYTLENVKLVAYDENGTEIPGIEILPGTVTATVNVTSPSKDLLIKVVPVGEVKPGSAINTISQNVQKVTVYGDQDVLDKLTYLEVNVDVKDLSEDKSFQLDLVRPSGIRSMSETSITVKITMEKETSMEVEGIQIQIENLPKGFKAQAINESNAFVTVIVKGVSSLLDTLDKATIKAIVDLSDIESEGVWDIPVTVTGDDLKLTYASKVKSVKINVTKEE